jgi:biopolymer transport protein ExbD
MRRAYAANRFVPNRSSVGPIADLNITPLIDVLLVLLVMFIITIPPLTHNVEIDLPVPGDGVAAERVTHRLALSRGGALSLDGVALSDAALPARLRAVREEPGALLLFRPDPLTRYERADQVLAVVKRAGVTRLGFEGLDAFVK